VSVRVLRDNKLGLYKKNLDLKFLGRYFFERKGDDDYGL
jgi:hypothetical protein